LERFRRRRLDPTQNPSLLQPLQPLHSGPAQSTCAFLSTTTTTPLHNLYAAWAKPISAPITTQQVNPCLQSLFLPNDKYQQFSKHFVEPTKPLRQAKDHPESLHWESDAKRHLSHQPVFRSTQQPKTLKSNKNITSRRLAQRRNKRALKHKNLSTIRQTQPLLQSVENRCLTNFGFIADPNTTLQKNFDVAIQRAPSHLFLQPKNLTFHNLCKVNNLPPGSKELLGLNLKFCLASKAVPDDINKTMIQLARSIRTRHFLIQNGVLNNTSYEKQIYKKNLTWNPPPAPTLIEDKLVELEKALKKIQQKLERKNASRQLTNITPLQAKALASLQKNKNIVIKPTDKNLGPSVMDTTDYVDQILTEHLLTDTYLQLTEGEAKYRLNDIKDTLKTLLANNANNLSKSEILFFKRSLQEHHRIPIFYGLPKVHKQPVTLRPVVSTSGSLLAIFSTWLDYRMKELLPLVQSHVKNSFTALAELKNLFIPNNALLFAADATSMYTNIEIDIGMSAIRSFLEDNKTRIPQDFPTEIFLKILNLVMQNNIFSFANTFWLQLTGTAMGTPAACAYATLTFGHYENTLILQKY
jgi:hypothetical protein